jgi:hypothetical protein
MACHLLAPSTYKSPHLIDAQSKRTRHRFRLRLLACGPVVCREPIAAASNGSGTRFLLCSLLLLDWGRRSAIRSTFGHCNNGDLVLKNVPSASLFRWEKALDMGVVQRIGHCDMLCCGMSPSSSYSGPLPACAHPKSLKAGDRLPESVRV